MNIYQLLPTLAYGDAVGDDAVAINNLIEKMGHKTAIYAYNIHSSYLGKIAFLFNEMPKVKKEDIIIYHLAVGSDMNYLLAKFECRIIIIYHNITPPEFFKDYDKASYNATVTGIEGMKFLSRKAQYCLADSEFNKQDLLKAGYKCPIDVLPILIPFDDYKQKPSNKVLKKFSDDRTNILFTGRMAPNKKVENVIKAFYMYKKYYDENARLFLVGSFGVNDSYYKKLRDYIYGLDISDVYFTGHIGFDEILAYYKLADIYLCMSEHEGFCVPLVEAMFFDVPIVAYDKCAIKYTLGGSGFLLDDNDPLLTAGVINKIVTNSALRDKLIEGQRTRLKDFGYDTVSAQFIKYLKSFIDSAK